jgi:Rieske Fe-S protein
MERRLFIKTACACCGVAAVVSFAESCKKEKIDFTVDLSDPINVQLQTPGNYIYQNKIIIICVTANTDYLALASTCTHSGCTLNFDHNNNQLTCPCHGGKFDTNGNVVAGPPPSPVKKYNTSVSGNILTITS